MKLTEVFSGEPALPQAILECRSRRADRQRALLTTGCAAVVSFTMNIPGPVKQFPLGRAGFEEGLDALHRAFRGHILAEERVDAVIGSEALLALDIPPETAKGKTLDIEQDHPLGRLFDMDVLGTDGVPLSRKGRGRLPRTCLLCAQDAKLCARSGGHPMEAVQSRVAEILLGYFRSRKADLYAACAVQGLLHEVSTTPKPGLVDRRNAGSHRDMDIYTFLNSSAALSPWFRAMFCLGWDNAGEPAELLFHRLRYAGQRAEADMLQATGGVNTHKGLIFSMGILCGALGCCCAENPAPPTLAKVIDRCKELGQCALADFSAPREEITHGLRCYDAHHAVGARGEAAEGFPTVLKVALPVLERWLTAGADLNDAAAITLVALLARTADTNMIHRGGYSRAAECRREAAALEGTLNLGNLRPILEALDDRYIRENLSPGGCADLLALSLMLHFLLVGGLVTRNI